MPRKKNIYVNISLTCVSLIYIFVLSHSLMFLELFISRTATRFVEQPDEDDSRWKRNVFVAGFIQTRLLSGLTHLAVWPLTPSAFAVLIWSFNSVQLFYSGKALCNSRRWFWFLYLRYAKRAEFFRFFDTHLTRCGFLTSILIIAITLCLQNYSKRV